MYLRKSHRLGYILYTSHRLRICIRSLCDLSTAFLANPSWCSHPLLSPQVSFLAAAYSLFGEIFSDRGINFGRASRGERTSVWTEGA